MKVFQFLLFSALLAGSIDKASALPEALGITNTTVLGNSDTRFSTPVHRPTAYNGKVKSVTGNTVTVVGTPRWPSNPQKWVYSAKLPDTYYVEFTTGLKKGMYYTVTANGAATLTLDLAGDAISGANGVRPGDAFKIIPYWTLNTIFTAQAGIRGTSNPQGIDAKTQILVTDPSASGIDLDPTGAYFYFTGRAFGGPGWRRFGGNPAQIRDHDILAPDTHVIIRQGDVPTARIMLCGVAPVNDRKYILGTTAANSAQDNVIGIDMPATLTLRQSNLFQSGAFAGTGNLSGNNGDLLLIFDNASTGFDKLPSAVYFYYTGTASGGPGWRELNGDASQICDEQQVFKPGSGCIIRKQAAPTPVTFTWPVPLPY